MHRRTALSALLAFGLTGGRLASAERPTLRVGPTRSLKRPSEAARIAPDGALIEIDAGDYSGDVAVWTQSGLLLRGIGGRARLHAAGRSAEGKAIWVIRGDRVMVEDIELSGCRVPHHNGAGIRAEGVGLTLRRCRLHHNEMGLLSSNHPAAEIHIEDCEADHNTTDTAGHGRLGHNLYIGRIARFVLTASHVHHAEVGHLVKPRARINQILGSRLLDGDGASSYLLDLAEGGEAEVTGNHFEQGPRSGNRTAIAFAPEARDKGSGHRLLVTDNRFVNHGSRGTFVRNHSEVSVELRNNRFEGNIQPLAGPGQVD